MIRVEHYPSGYIKTINWQFSIPAYSTVESTAFVYAFALILAEAVIR